MGLIRLFIFICRLCGCLDLLGFFVIFLLNIVPLAGFVMLIVLIVRHGIIESKKCEKCGEPGMEEVGERIKKEYSTNKKVYERTRDKNGNVVSTHEHYVPVTKEVREKIYRCKFCGFERTEEYEREK